MEQIINIREHPEWLERAADYFSSRWDIDRQLYLDSMNDSLTTVEALPRWYLMLRNAEPHNAADDGVTIIGGFGLIDNDFMVRTDLYPWMCAVYIEPAERGKQLGEKLLEHSRREAASLGFNKVYLNTDHIGYYEKYNWSYFGDFAHQSGVDTRVYEADVIFGGVGERYLSKHEKTQATTKLFSELEKGEKNGLEMGWLPADEVEAKLGISDE